jgi:hypothetical protein
VANRMGRATVAWSAVGALALSELSAWGALSLRDGPHGTEGVALLFILGFVVFSTIGLILGIVGTVLRIARLKWVLLSQIVGTISSAIWIWQTYA